MQALSLAWLDAAALYTKTVVTITAFCFIDWHAFTIGLRWKNRHFHDVICAIHSTLQV